MNGFFSETSFGGNRADVFRSIVDNASAPAYSDLSPPPPPYYLLVSAKTAALFIGIISEVWMSRTSFRMQIAA